MAIPGKSSRTSTPKTPTGRRSPAVSTAGSESSAFTDSERKTPNGNGGAAFGPGGGSGMPDRAESAAVRVVVRVRPQNKKEIDAGGTECLAFPSEV